MFLVHFCTDISIRSVLTALITEFLQVFVSISVEMPKAFLVRGDIKEEPEGNFPSATECASGTIFLFILWCEFCEWRHA